VLAEHSVQEAQRVYSMLGVFSRQRTRSATLLPAAVTAVLRAPGALLPADALPADPELAVVLDDSELLVRTDDGRVTFVAPGVARELAVRLGVAGASAEPVA
jgi:hypothetical protein